MSEILNNDIDALLASFSLEENVPKSEILSPEEIDKLLSLISSSEDDDKKEIYYPHFSRDFKTIVRLTKDDFDANIKFINVLAEELRKCLEKKYSKCFKSIKIYFTDFYMDNFKGILRWFDYSKVVTSCLWNKRYSAFYVEKRTLYDLIYKNNAEKCFEEFDYRNLTEKEIVFYKKNIEKLFFKSLIKTCKRKKCFNNNTLKHPKFSKIKYITDLEWCKYCLPVEDYEGMMQYFIDFEVETAEDKPKVFYLHFRFAFDWRLAKEVAVCINRKKEKQQKYTQEINSEINKNEKSVKVQLGNTKMSLKEIKNIKKDSFVELDDTSGIVDIVVDNRIIAKGTINSIQNKEKDEKYVVYVTEVL